MSTIDQSESMYDVQLNKSSSSPSPFAIAWKNLNYKLINYQLNYRIPLTNITNSKQSSLSRRKLLFTQNYRSILSNLCGHFQTGTLNGLMGPSGAGKTTLLQCLSGGFVSTGGLGLGVFSSTGMLTSDTEILMPNNHHQNNISCTPMNDSGPSCCFIEQHVHETIVPRMRVGDILRYAYLFKNPNSLISKSKSSNNNDIVAQHIKRICNQLLLDPKILNRKFHSCSGGEQKRIAIAQELMSLTPPSILFVDEPTTGLDSTSALVVMRALKRLTTITGTINNDGTTSAATTVIVSIHSPNDEILNMFDQLYVLAKSGGRCIYAGRPDGILAHLQQNDALDRLQSDQPPVEILIRLACDGIANPTVERLANCTNRTQSAQLEPLLKAYYASAPSSVLSNIACGWPGATTSTTGYPLPVSKCFNFRDFYLELSRQFHITFRCNYGQIALLCLILTLYYLMIHAMFTNEKTTISGCYPLVSESGNITVTNDFGTVTASPGNMDNITSSDTISSSSSQQPQLTDHQLSCLRNFDNELLIYENITSISYVCLMLCFIHMSVNSLVFSANLRVFRSEHRNHWYSLGVFYWSSVLVRFLELHIYILLSAVLSYVLTNQLGGDAHLDLSIRLVRFASYTLFLWLLGVLMQCMGQLIGIILMDHVELAILISQLVCALNCLFNGFYLNIERVSRANAWFGDFAYQLGTIFITRGLIYTIYGIDRCDFQQQFSIVLIDHSVEVDQVYQWYIVKIIQNILIIISITFGFLYIKFTNWIPLQRYWLPNSTSDDQKIVNISTIKKEIDPTLSKISIKDQCSDSSIDIAKPQLPLSSFESSISVTLSPITTTQTRAENKELIQQISGKIAIAWRNLSLYGTRSWWESFKSSTPNTTVSTSIERKKILNNLNGELRFGTLNALMGTSGAGKTSLLRVLNGQYKSLLSLETKIFLSKYVKIQSCFITQEVSGHLWPGLTVQQVTLYASKLKNITPKMSVTQTIDHHANVRRVLGELGLLDCSTTLVANCSGGERKRLAIALELTAIECMPNLIAIDEPTSGLDTNSAELVIETLRSLAHRYVGVCIVCSIHQPHSQIWSQFDYAYILARGGRTVYAGTVNDSALVKHLDAIANDTLDVTQHQCNSNDNQQCQPKCRKILSVHALEQLIKYSCAADDQSDESLTSSSLSQPISSTVAVKRLNQLCHKQTLDTVTLTQDCIHTINGVEANRTRFSLHSCGHLIARYGVYVRTILWYHYTMYAVVYFAYGIALRNFFDPQMAKISGCVDLERDETNQTVANCRDWSADAFEETKLLMDNHLYTYFYTNIYLFMVLLQASLNFFREYPHFINEHRNGWYSTGSYYVMKSVYEILPVIPITVIFVLIGASLAEQVRPGEIYYPMIALLILSAIGFQAIGHCFAILSGGNFFHLTIITMSVYLLMMTIGTFVVPLHKQHYIFQFLSNFSILRFLFEANLLLQYGFGRCSGSSEVQVLLESKQLNDEHFYRAVVMLIFNLLFYRILAIVMLINSQTNNNDNDKDHHRCHYADKDNNETNQSVSKGFHIKMYSIM